MIKANELRIGNWVDNRGEMKAITGIVSGIAIGVVYFDKHTNESSGTHLLDPIPITPEILERAGFVKNGFKQYELKINDKSFSCVQKKLFFAGDYLYLEELVEGGRPKNSDILTIWNKDLMKTFYLHQLQNLIHALTGEELNINL